jgi:hypothetical protein
MDGSITPDPESQEVAAELWALVDEDCAIEYPCGWSGTERELTGTKVDMSLELSCPSCGQTLVAIGIDYDD